MADEMITQMFVKAATAELHNLLVGGGVAIVITLACIGTGTVIRAVARGLRA